MPNPFRNLNSDELSRLLACAGWRPERRLERQLVNAGLLTLRAFGETVAHMEAISVLDGEPEPTTLDEAMVLLRRMAERTGLTPMGVLMAFTAGNLAGTSLCAYFTGMQDCWMQGGGVTPC